MGHRKDMKLRETTAIVTCSLPAALFQGSEVSAETSNEGLAAAALSDVMLQMYPAEVPGLLAGTFKAMAHMIASPDIPVQVT